MAFCISTFKNLIFPFAKFIKICHSCLCSGPGIPRAPGFTNTNEWAFGGLAVPLGMKAERASRKKHIFSDSSFFYPFLSLPVFLPGISRVGNSEPSMNKGNSHHQVNDYFRTTHWVSHRISSRAQNYSMGLHLWLANSWEEVQQQNEVRKRSFPYEDCPATSMRP